MLPENPKSRSPATTATGENESPDSLMNWTVKYVKENRFVRVTVTGLYNLEDHMRMLKDVASREFWTPGMNLLIDDRNLEFPSLSLEELREAGRRRAELDALIGAGRTAVLVSSLVNFGRARQFQLITSGKVSTKMDIFKDENEAIEWLLA